MNAEEAREHATNPTDAIAMALTLLDRIAFALEEIARAKGEAA